ncbi:Glycoside hydrolase family 5 protein [Mycena kentingensis (nom. inval.)]|nr:Glycoside hydrolase family 5 protein [Mycena kentingensis (nom. inval.)]
MSDQQQQPPPVYAQPQPMHPAAAGLPPIHVPQPYTPISPGPPAPLTPYLDSPSPNQGNFQLGFQDEDYGYPPPPSPMSAHSPHVLPTPPGSPRLTGKERAVYAAGQGRGYGYGGPTAQRKSMMVPPVNERQQGRRRKRMLYLGLLILLIAGVAVVAVILVRRSSSSDGDASSSDSDSGSTSGTSGTSKTQNLVTTGTDGSTVVMDSGDTFTYTNSFGGYWLADPENPTWGGRPNSWTPLLNETWTYGVDRIHGVNVGGWFVLEPFIAPALFQPYPSAEDEWSLSQQMKADGTLAAKLEEHYATFITEEDFAQIAAAGLNWVRIPIPFWAVETWQNTGTDAYGTGANGGDVTEPFLERVCWKYIVRAIGWARKYGLRVNLDLHTIPGSQNGYNHSGKFGQINFLNGPMGIANAQRALDYMRIITEFISQQQFQDVVQIFGIMNEAVMATIGQDQLWSFYLEAHDMIREVTGFGAGNGPFGGEPNNEPIATSEDPLAADAGGYWPNRVCTAWGPGMNSSRTNVGVTTAGEWSNGFNDCGMYLKGVNGSTSYGGDCKFWEESQQWNTSVKAGIQAFALAQMDTLEDYFFWTWKIGEAQDGIVRSPLWSYKAGLEGGWMPKDPRVAQGKCAQVGATRQPWVGTFSSWQTGGAGAGTVDPNARSRWGQYPPATISNAKGSILLTYTSTATIPTLVYATPTVVPTGVASQSVLSMPAESMGSGWANSADTAPAVGPIAGCLYPNAWNAIGLPAPTAAC